MTDSKNICEISLVYSNSQLTLKLE